MQKYSKCEVYLIVKEKVALNVEVKGNVTHCIVFYLTPCCCKVNKLLPQKAHTHTLVFQIPKKDYSPQCGFRSSSRTESGVAFTLAERETQLHIIVLEVLGSYCPKIPEKNS